MTIGVRLAMVCMLIAALVSVAGAQPTTQWCPPYGELPVCPGGGGGGGGGGR